MLKHRDQISLKEAAEISGYTPDYLGQLIRSGKLPGEQVFLNVAWVTTEAAVLEYMQKNKSSMATAAQSRAKVLTSQKTMTVFYKAAVWVVIAVLVCFVLFLVSVLAVSFDHKIEKRYEQKIEHVK